MNLIKKILKNNATNDYFFIEYRGNSGAGIVALAVRKNTMFYDVDNNCYVELHRVLFHKPLNSYEEIEEEIISIKTAKKIAKKYYNAFAQDFKDYFCKENGILENPDHTFYFMV